MPHPQRVPSLLQLAAKASALSLPRLADASTSLSNLPLELREHVMRETPPHILEQIVGRLEDLQTYADINRCMKECEDYYRHLFATNRAHVSLDDPHLTLYNAFESRSEFQYRETSYDREVPKLLTQARKLRQGPSIVDKNTFEMRFNEFTNGLFAGMDWKNMVVAGGAVLGCLLLDPSSEASVMPGFEGADIDVFFYGLNDREADEKVRHVHDVLCRNYGQGIHVVRTTHAVTFLFDYPFRHVQIVLRMYKSPAEVIMGFDIDACCVLYDGQTVWVLPRARRAINHTLNYVDMSRRSLTYEYRLYKYSKRGFGVAVPMLKTDRIDLQVYRKDQSPVQAKGLKRLLLWDYRECNKGASLGEARGDDFGGFNWRPYGEGWPSDDLSGQQEQTEAEFGPQRASDYMAVFIPYGPKWNAASIVSMLLKKDHSAVFSEIVQSHNPIDHKHVYVSGIDEVLNGLSSWCLFCQQKRSAAAAGAAAAASGAASGPQGKKQPKWRGGRPRGARGMPMPEAHDHDAADEVVLGPIRWLRDDPGRQLLTGSFHPIDDDAWEEGVYLPDEKARVNKLCFLAWAGAVEEATPLLADAAIVNGKDSFTNRTPACWAALAGRVQMLEALRAAGADLTTLDGKGRAPIHYAAGANQPEVVRMLVGAGVASANQPDGLCDTPLHLAIRLGPLGMDTVHALLALGADVNMGGCSFHTPLLTATIVNNVPAVSALLQAGANPTLLGIFRGQRVAALQLAQSLEHNEVAALLSAAVPAEPVAAPQLASRAEAPRYQADPVAQAPGRKRGSPEGPVAQTLLARATNFALGPDAAAINSSLGRFRGRRRFRRGVQAPDTDADAGAAQQKVPSMLRLAGQTADAVARTLQAGTGSLDVDEADAAGVTALHYAAYCDSAEVVRELLAAGADPSLPDAAGQTPLHYAAARGAARSMLVLLRGQAPVDSVDIFGRTPLSLCVAHDLLLPMATSSVCTSLLRRAGARMPADPSLWISSPPTLSFPSSVYFMRPQMTAAILPLAMARAPENHAPATSAGDPSRAVSRLQRKMAALQLQLQVRRMRTVGAVPARMASSARMGRSGRQRQLVQEQLREAQAAAARSGAALTRTLPAGALQLEPGWARDVTLSPLALQEVREETERASVSLAGAGGMAMSGLLGKLASMLSASRGGFAFGPTPVQGLQLSAAPFAGSVAGGAPASAAYVGFGAGSTAAASTPVTGPASLAVPAVPAAATAAAPGVISMQQQMLERLKQQLATLEASTNPADAARIPMLKTSIMHMEAQLARHAAGEAAPAFVFQAPAPVAAQTSKPVKEEAPDDGEWEDDEFDDEDDEDDEDDDGEE